MKTSFRPHESLSGNAQYGMTLIEIMVVVIIIALLATGVAVSVVRIHNDTLPTIAQKDISSVLLAIEVYRLHNPAACPTLEILKEEGYLKRRNRVTDPWNTKYVIDCSGEEIDVFSAGPDKQENTDDEIH